MSDASGDTRSAWERGYSLATTFVAPATFLTTLLFYFGYVWSREQYRYFGLDIDTVGLSTRDFVMRSPQALLVPVLLLTLLGALLLVLHRLLERRVTSPRAIAWASWVAGGIVLAGLVLLFSFAWLGSWPPYPMVTALVLAVGLLALAWVWHRSGGRRGSVVLALLGVATCLFWATATLAQWTGLGAAQRTARNLDELPAVVLDTKESLYLNDGVVEESILPTREGQEFAFRYRGFRLLIQAGDRMFLVPAVWTDSNSTVLVPLDDVRVRFRFVNDPP